MSEKFLALLWQANGKPMCLIDSRDENGIALEGVLGMLQTMFPEAKARMAFVNVEECSSSTADTLSPPPDPFSEVAIRATMPTLPETLVERDRAVNRGLKEGR